MSVKKLLLISAAAGVALAGSTAALAGGPDSMGCHNIATAMDGLYAGVGITRNTGYAIVSRGSNPTTNVAVEGWGARAQLGYGSFVKGNFYVGAEGNLEITDAKTQNVSNGANGTAWGVEDKWNFGLAFVPGYRLMPNVLLFGKVGFERADLDVTEGSVSNTEGVNGMVFGAGLAAAVTRNVDMRIEYNYYKLNKEQMRVNATSGSVTPRFDVTALTLNYHVTV